MNKITTKMLQFLNNQSKDFLMNGNKVYTKIRYNNDLTFVYCTDDAWGYDDITAEVMREGCNWHHKLVGVYSPADNDFIFIKNSYAAKDFYEDGEDVALEKTLRGLQNHLNECVKVEIENIINIEIKANASDFEDYKDTALEMIAKNTAPSLNLSCLDNADENLQFDDLLPFCRDENNFAYERALVVLDKYPQIKKDAQYQANLKAAIEFYKNDRPIKYDVKKAFKDAIIGLKTVNLELTKDGKTISNSVLGVKIRGRWGDDVAYELDNYPLCSIKNMYWGKKKIFSLDDYDADKVEEMRLDWAFMLEDINKAKGEAANMFFSYLDERLWENREFCQKAALFNTAAFKFIPDKFKVDTIFLHNLLNANLSPHQLFGNLTNEEIFANKDIFVGLVTDEHDFWWMPDALFADEDFAEVMLRVDALPAMTYLDEKLLATPKFQNILDEVFASKPASTLSHNSYERKAGENLIYPNLSWIKNEETVLNAVTAGTVNSIDDGLKKNREFAYKVIDKIKADVEKFLKTNNSIYLPNFSNVFSTMVLAFDESVVDKEFLEKLYDTEVTMSDDFWTGTGYSTTKMPARLKEDKEIQYMVAQRNFKLAAYMDEDVKKKLVLEDDMYFPLIKTQSYEYLGGRYGTRKTTKDYKFDEDLLLTLAQQGRISKFGEISNCQWKDLELSKKLLQINPNIYRYMPSDLKTNRDMAKIAVDGGVSIVGLIPEMTQYNYKDSLYNDKELMLKCLDIDPRCFKDMPQKSRSLPYVPVLMADKEFVVYALQKYPNNIEFLRADSPLKEDEDVIIETLSRAPYYIGTFKSSKLLKDQSFVEKYLKKFFEIHKASDDDYVENLYDLKSNIITKVAKAVKTSPSFMESFPNLEEELSKCAD
jgi:hypothetical protein